MRAMNKYQRNLGIIAYPQQYELGRQQFGRGNPMTKIAQLAANTVGRHLGKSKAGQKLMSMAKSKVGRNLIKLSKSRIGRKFLKMAKKTVGRQMMKSDTGRKLLKMAESDTGRKLLKMGKSKTARHMIKSAKKSMFTPDERSFKDFPSSHPPRKRKHSKRKTKKPKTMFQTGGRLSSKPRTNKGKRDPTNYFFPRDNVWI